MAVEYKTLKGIKEAVDYIKQCAGNLPIYWGTGNPVYKDHVQAVHYPWEYWVTWRNGDNVKRYLSIKLVNNH
jgi:hypothetical protein